MEIVGFEFVAGGGKLVWGWGWWNMTCV